MSDESQHSRSLGYQSQKGLGSIKLNDGSQPDSPPQLLSDEGADLSQATKVVVRSRITVRAGCACPEIFEVETLRVIGKVNPAGWRRKISTVNGDVATWN